MSDSHDEETDRRIEDLKKAGRIAKITLYQTIVRKIEAGEMPTLTEQRTLATLESELTKLDTLDREGAKEPQNVIDGIEELARKLNKSRRTLYRWINAGMPMLSGDRFDLDAVDEWLLRKKGGRRSKAEAVFTHPPLPGLGSGGSQGEGRDRKSQDFVSDDDIEDKDFWDMRSKKEQALDRAMKRRKLQGELVERRFIEDLFISRILEVKHLILGLESVLPPDLIHSRTDREMSEIIRKHTRRALMQFARPLPFNTGPYEGLKDSQDPQDSQD